MAPDADRARRAIPERLAEAADSGAARDPRDRLGGDENSAIIVEWGAGVRLANAARKGADRDGGQDARSLPSAEAKRLHEWLE